MIIVEGFDTSGKSTLALKIAGRLGWPVLHTGGPTTDEADVVRCLVRSESRMRQQCVQDRVTHISESVYSMTAFPYKAALALSAIKNIPPHVMVIYCRPPTEFLLEALQSEHNDKEWDTDAHMARVVHHAPQMIAFYDTVMAMVGHRVTITRFDRSQAGSTERILDLVRERYK